ncbi:hypothetical protein NCS52_00425200 [Fusarium sp. LHS14.1]|nr:hypothetical protein NCS52_00425200 [Fusarium sp. LHS14.1]
MSGHSAAAWLDTVLSGRDSHPDSVTADSSPHSKRRRLQPPTPETPQARTDDGAPVASGVEAPTQHLPDTNEEPQTSHSSDHQQTTPIVSSPSPAMPREDDESDISDDSWIGSADDKRFRVKKREFDELDPFSSPSSLEALLKQIRKFSDGVGILSSSAQRRFNKLKREEMEWARQGSKSNKHYSKERESLGKIPSPEEVISIVFKNAQYSFIEDDRGWRINMDMGVNNRVLSLAIEEPGGVMMLNSLEISAASISDKFNKGFGDKGMADFCIYLHLDSKRYPKVRNDIDRLYESPEGTRINHTNFEPLTYFPIALSINTGG